MGKIDINQYQYQVKESVSGIDLTELIKLTDAKNNQRILCDFYSQYSESKLRRSCSCVRIVEFIRYEHVENLQQKLKATTFLTCDLRFCAVCSWRRQIKFAKMIYEVLEKLQSKMKLRFLFLTLTVKNPELIDLKSTVQDMQKSFQRMIQTVRWKKSILGYCRVLEITRPKCDKQIGEVHPHFHVLLAVEPSYFNGRSGLYLKQDDFSEMWQKALRADYKPICDVRITKSKGDKNQTLASIAELIKYPMKDTDLSKFSVEEFQILEEHMRNVRLINFGGLMKEGNKQEIDSVELVEEDIEMWREIEKLLYEYSRDQKKYLLKKSMKIEG